jgi:cytochrome c553
MYSGIGHRISSLGRTSDLLRVVRDGRPGTAMTPWKGLISDDDIRTIARYVKQLSPDAPR